MKEILKEIRDETDKLRPSFAKKLGIGETRLAKYEAGRIPEPEVLKEYIKYCNEDQKNKLLKEWFKEVCSTHNDLKDILEDHLPEDEKVILNLYRKLKEK